MQLKQEPDNSVDQNAVAVVKIDGSIVGHVSYSLAPTFSSFLKRDFNKAMVEITGDKVEQAMHWSCHASIVSMALNYTRISCRK